MQTVERQIKDYDKVVCDESKGKPSEEVVLLLIINNFFFFVDYLRPHAGQEKES